MGTLKSWGRRVYTGEGWTGLTFVFKLDMYVLPSRHSAREGELERPVSESEELLQHKFIRDLTLSRGLVTVVGISRIVTCDLGKIIDASLKQAVFRSVVQKSRLCGLD